MSVLQFEGTFRLWKLDGAGVKTPVIPNAADPYGNQPVEVSSTIFSYAAGDVKKLVSKQVGRYGQTIYSDTLPGETSIAMTFIEIPTALLGRIYYGDAVTTTVTSSTITAEPLTVEEKGVPLRLAKRFMTSGSPVVVKDATDTTTYVLNTDYTVDPVRATITVKNASAIDVDDILHVTYTVDAHEVQTIAGGTKAQESFYITGYMVNRPDKQSGVMNISELEIFNANLQTDGDVDLMSDDLLTLTLKGTLLTPSDKTSPFVVVNSKQTI